MIDNKHSISDEILDNISGGSKPERKAKCPKCGKYTFVVKYKRFECSSCGFVRPMQ